MSFEEFEPDLRGLATRLERDRPLPGPAFRGDLGRRLASSVPQRPRPRRLRLLVAGQLGTGALLLGAAALGALAHAGPLAL